MKRYKAIAEYYDSEYANLEMLKHDVPFFLGQLPRKKQTVLELAVGTARAAIPIAQAGHRAVGVDYARDLLTIADRKRRGAGLKDRELSLVYGDVRKLDLGRTFDWVIILFNTFLAYPTLEEQDRLLQVVRRHLKPNGRFWVDIFQPDLQILAGSQKKNFEPRCFYVPQFNRTVYSTTTIERDLARQVQNVTFNYSWFDEFGVTHRERNKFEMTWIFPRELRVLLERNGLEIEKLWGNYDGSKLTSSSPRMIARCVKA